jgi:type I site-specific restriction-modification system R (restriction) subunit
MKIGLTGTPLLGNEYNSRQLFGNYIHKYYYNSSIADGYTLGLIREEIETSYSLLLKKALEENKIAWSRYNSYLKILEGDDENYRQDVFNDDRIASDETRK